MKSISKSLPDHVVRDKADLQLSYFPLATIKCRGPVVFRSQVSRDYACLLDLNPGVYQWSCSNIVLRHENHDHLTDFVVTDIDGENSLVTVGVNALQSPLWASSAANALGYGYRYEVAEDFSAGVRLRNAKDLLRYGFHRCPLGDRIRLLAALEEHGSFTVAECFPAFQESKPMPGLAALILNGFVEVDLDSALLSPETAVRRIRE